MGDLLLIKSGEPVPMDCKILWGEASINEAIISGESAPVEKRMNDKLIGGSTLDNGTVKAYVTAVGEDTVLSNILKMVKEAQTEKPPIQQLADKISAVFCSYGNKYCPSYFFDQLFFRASAFQRQFIKSYCRIGYFLSLCHGPRNTCCHCSWPGQGR